MLNKQATLGIKQQSKELKPKSCTWMVPSQSLDRQTLDTTNSRHNLHKRKQTPVITNASYVLCYIMSYVYHI